MVDSATTTLYCYVEYGDVESRSSYEGVEYCARKRSSSGPFDTCEVSREGRLRSNQASRLNAWRTKSSESKGQRLLLGAVKNMLYLCTKRYSLGGHTCGDTYEKQSKTIKFKTSMVHWMDMESIGGRDRAF
ncbi:hypothetical protein F444_00394 [Phytophthora nicotianae P1976]|nr:hypothetical protein F444_00394 [Phytophthora nicotianae P1976]